MEGDEAEAPLLEKLDARVPLPIWTGCWDEDLFVIDDAIEGYGAGVSHQSREQREGCRGKCKRKKKKRYHLSPKPKVQQWQAQGSELLYVVSAGPGPTNQNQLAWEVCMVDDAALSDSTEGRMTKEVVESVWSMDSTSRTLRRTLELAGRIGKRPVRMLIDSGTTRNYISAQECSRMLKARVFPR